ncbi:hypothetical protein MKQ68_24170 [Chitinophaga horti]|uniref:Lipocalin-like domain-containing protein n=1 Tax=Chitinophaga horti TaxID=2920382 RepID=A0ABY6J0J1_9BACT|nr:lipocalin family protein [Chitinophaga horti]UYQ93183.1 hypothetical protein MKQ68_24170 [Chitinophaga horti]
MKKVMIIVAAIATTLFACEKEETIDNASTAAAFLKAGEWVPTTIDQNPVTSPAGKLLYNPVLECQKDDTYKFSADSMTVNKGATLCGGDETGYQVKYSMDFNRRKITINGVEYMLGEVTPKQLKYYVRLSSQAGYDYQVYIFTHAK